MKKLSRRIALVFMILLFGALHGCGTTMKGRIVDADTNQPIVGAVVVASWLEETGTLAGGSTRPKLVKECVTDKNGEWKITGPSGATSHFAQDIYTYLTLFTNFYYTLPPELVYYKPGYCSYPGGYGIKGCKDRFKFEDKTLHLPKLPDRREETLSLNRPHVAAGWLGTPILDNLYDQDLHQK